MALPRANRLSLRFERDRLTKTGKTVHGKFFTVVIAPAPTETSGSLVLEPKQSIPPTPRLAILLSKKTASLAVDRNKIKRITSAIIESILSSISPKDYLVIPKRQVLTAPFQDLQKDLSNLLKSS